MYFYPIWNSGWWSSHSPGHYWRQAPQNFQETIQFHSKRETILKSLPVYKCHRALKLRPQFVPNPSQKHPQSIAKASQSVPNAFSKGSQWVPNAFQNCPQSFLDAFPMFNVLRKLGIQSCSVEGLKCGNN